MDTLPWARGSSARRFVNLLLSLALAGVALLLLGRWVGRAAAAGAGRAVARPAPANFFFPTTLDLPDNNLADGECHVAPNGPCSLRAAVQQLDHDSGGSISLPAGTFNLTDDADGDLNLRQNIHLTGVTTAQTRIQGNPSGWNHRMLRVQGGATVLLASLTISGGHVPGLSGGGIAVLSGTLIAIDVLLTHNQAGLGGGLYNAGSAGPFSHRFQKKEASTPRAGLFNIPNSPPAPPPHP